MTKITTIDVIERFVDKYGERYDYSQVKYQNSNEKVIIICKNHGPFLQTVSAHLRGRCCAQCSQQSQSHNQKSMIEKFISIHGDRYDYSKSVYKGVKNQVTITCYTHGDFNQRVDGHFQGNGCKACADADASARFVISRDSLIERFNKVHFYKYDYSLTDYKNCRTKISIICYKHGEFKQRPTDHEAGKGCPSCKSSKGESKIRDFLNLKGIVYEEQYPLCQNPATGFPLRADFYIPSLNIVIEFDGIQHFQPVFHWGGFEGFLKNQERDTIKNEFCSSNNITLLRVSYLDLKKINIILSDFFRNT